MYTKNSNVKHTTTHTSPTGVSTSKLNKTINFTVLQYYRHLFNNYSTHFNALFDSTEIV